MSTNASKYKRFFFYATDYLHNTKTNSKLKYTTDPYLIFGDQTGETEKVKKQNKTSPYYIYLLTIISSRN